MAPKWSGEGILSKYDLQTLRTISPWKLPIPAGARKLKNFWEDCVWVISPVLSPFKYLFIYHHQTPLWHSCFIEKFKINKINGKTILTLVSPSRARLNEKVKENGLAFFWPNWSRWSVRGPNTQIQIHKYTNTVWSDLQIDKKSVPLAPHYKYH